MRDGVDQRPSEGIGDCEGLLDASALRFGSVGVEVDGVEGLVVFHCAAVELWAGVCGLWAQGLRQVGERGRRLCLGRRRLASRMGTRDVGWDNDVLVAVREVLCGIVDLRVRVTDFFDAGVRHLMRDCGI